MGFGSYLLSSKLFPSLITKEELNGITEAIYNRYGIDFRSYETVSLQRRITRLMHRHKLDSVYHLWQKILYEKEFVQVFINEVTIGFTELFRNASLWQALKEDILLKIPNTNPLKIWHAGCATGEEVYSMLILLQELKKLDTTQILATDINTEFMAQVRQGKYDISLWEKFNKNYQSFVQSSQKDLSQYAEPQEDWFVFKKYLRKNLEVRFHNLTQFPQKQTFQLVLCRNVLIYFDETLKKQVLNLLCESIQPGGYLILGFYDTLPTNIDLPLQLVNPSLKLFSKI